LLKKVANIVRGLAADGVEEANSGHPGMPIGCADIGALLFGELMNFDASAPKWPDRDRFALSAGHGSMFLYSFLHLAGYDLSIDDLKNFRQLDSPTPGHPEYRETDGVETTTGPLGQGFANAVGMALSERMMAARFNTEEIDIVDHYTYTILGDGCMMEGISSEAASLAGHLGLGKLIAIYDDNEISIAGKTDLAFTESVADRFRAFNWHVIKVDGHDIDSLRKAIEAAKEDANRPSLIVANTHIAYGAPKKQDTSDAHGAPLGEDEIKGLKEKFGLPVDKKFYVSAEVREFFKTRKAKLQEKRLAWEEKFEKWSAANPELKVKWDNGNGLILPENFRDDIMNLEISAPEATRKASGKALTKVADLVDYLVGGSADLAPSTKTYLDKYGEIQKDDYSGRNIRFGVREFSMAAIANGMVLHGGLRPFVATFLVFSDYMRSAIRLSALMKQPVIYVFTHDSIYIGEDGPTHQPVEQVESLRLIPGLKVLRPADEEETKAAWVQAMERTDGPTALILTRQGLPHLEKEAGQAAIFQGGYTVESEADPELLFLASGSEVALAVETAALMREKGHSCQVVSLPDIEQYIEEGHATELPDAKLRIALEAGKGRGWYRLINHDDLLISVETFGKSAPGEQVAADFGFTPAKVAEKILKKLS